MCRSSGREGGSGPHAHRDRRAAVPAEPAGKASVGARSYLKLNRVTALVGGPLVELRAGKTGEMMRTGGLVPLDVDADECLFAAVPGAGQPLVEFDGIDPADAKTVLAWQVRKSNR